MKTPEKLWMQYSKTVYPDGIGETQEHETRQAYMAGMLSVIHEMVIDANNSDDQEVLVQQLDTFHDQLKKHMLVNLFAPTEGGK